MRLWLRYIPLIILSLLHSRVSADELSLHLGAGLQPGSDQRNDIVGIEYSFYTFKRSDRQHLQVGVSYSEWQSNVSATRLRSISVFPQLTFYPGPQSWLSRSMPESIQPLFFARVLGPSYISESSLGARNQANHFAFHAQLGAGFVVELESDMDAVVHFSWRHISNANLFSPNDGIDVPFVLTAGFRF